MSEFPTFRLWFTVRDHHRITVTSLTPKSPWFSSLIKFKTRIFCKFFTHAILLELKLSTLTPKQDCNFWTLFLGFGSLSGPGPVPSQTDSGHLFQFWNIPFLGTLFQKCKCVFQKWVSMFQTWVRSFQKWNERVPLPSEPIFRTNDLNFWLSGRSARQHLLTKWWWVA